MPSLRIELRLIAYKATILPLYYDGSYIIFLTFKLILKNNS